MVITESDEKETMAAISREEREKAGETRLSFFGYISYYRLFFLEYILHSFHELWYFTGISLPHFLAFLIIYDQFPIHVNAHI